MLAAAAAGAHPYEPVAWTGGTLGAGVGVVVPLVFALPLPLPLLVGVLGGTLCGEGGAAGSGGACHPNEVEELPVPG